MRKEILKEPVFVKEIVDIICGPQSLERDNFLADLRDEFCYGKEIDAIIEYSKKRDTQQENMRKEMEEEREALRQEHANAIKEKEEENIEKTKKVVELAAKYGATVEAELGLVGGSEDGKSDHGIRCTNPEDAKIFCEETGIDALAVAIGNAHGDYPVAPQLEFGVLEEIHDKTGIPLVLHGGSGITDADFQKAISLGIRKVNIATASFKSLTKEVENYLATEGAHNYFDMNEAMVLGTYKNVKHHIEVFNCK